MPLNIKTSQIAVKNPQTGQYMDVDMLGDSVISVNNKAGAVSLDAGDIFIDDSAQNPETISDAIGDVSRALNDKYEKPSTGIPASDLANGVIPSVPVQDVQVNGTSILSGGVANIPTASAAGEGRLGVVKPGNGLTANETTGNISVNTATDANVKAGGDWYKPIVPGRQHISAFYGLTKAAGVDMASSSNPVGTYTDAAKIAIQKMLGIYEAPWELIREDTVTNDTEADIEITVDGNGQTFELTDVYLQVWTPQQETAASIGDYATVRNYYDNSNFITSQMYTWSQTEGAGARYGQVLLTNENGAIKNIATQNNTQYSLINVTARTNITADDALMKIGTFTFQKTVIRKVTGTLKYKLYGKRKWN